MVFSLIFALMFLSCHSQFRLIDPRFLPDYCKHFADPLTYKLIYHSRPPVTYWNPAFTSRPTIYKTHGLSGFVVRHIPERKKEIIYTRGGKKRTKY